ncbi:transcriptional regulator [Desulfonatronum thioautotrophicum]|uniref:transcriptional regulator n=1 Tax=Desulfonatronum thioautotrophicum TaxID=617001 RepID=UPI0005EB879B|nr:transcriptional regulator [Desulfonatronum thioautotrophicum]
MLKFLIFIAAIFILYKLLMGDLNKKKEVKEKEHENLAANGVMTKDPVCGTYVPVGSDIRIKEGDNVHCFCSYECRDSYMKKLGAGKE